VLFDGLWCPSMFRHRGERERLRAACSGSVLELKFADEAMARRFCRGQPIKRQTLGRALSVGATFSVLRVGLPVQRGSFGHGREGPRRMGVADGQAERISRILARQTRQGEQT